MIDRNHHEKTIEGDLFSAFVAAGAISKANADDPKKSSLIRCARTDKGVHAGGNLISLKLIVEDADIVAKINEQLDPQIRIWGFGRTNGGFSSYQHCDSRIYEYLIPSHCFLPPHPKSFLAKRLEELAEEANDRDGYRGRQEEVADFWTEAEKYLIQPVIDKLDPAIRDKVLDIFYGDSSDNSAQERPNEADNQRQAIKGDTTEGPYTVGIADPTITPHLAAAKEEYTQSKSEGPRKLTPTEVAVRELKAAYTDARNGYRIHPARLARVRSAFSRFEGSHKFHNYTINKSFKDASVTRVMKSLSVRENPLLVGGTEWLSVKIHGQSFMMHQIRKMVSMIALVVRCGCPEERLQESYLPERISIPKAPSLGLLLERPVFDVYNEQLEKFGRERIDFGKYSTEMEEFKQREIYERIYHEEGRDGCFHSFFTALDNTKSPQLLYLSSVGMKATERDIPRGNTGLRKDGGDVAQDVDQSSSDDEMQDGEEE